MHFKKVFLFLFHIWKQSHAEAINKSYTYNVFFLLFCIKCKQSQAVQGLADQLKSQKVFRIKVIIILNVSVVVVDVSFFYFMIH